MDRSVGDLLESCEVLREGDRGGAGVRGLVGAKRAGAGLAVSALLGAVPLRWEAPKLPTPDGRPEAVGCADGVREGDPGRGSEGRGRSFDVGLGALAPWPTVLLKFGLEPGPTDWLNLGREGVGGVFLAELA